LAKKLQRLFLSKEEVIALYIHQVDTTVPEAALVALKKESLRLFHKVLVFGIYIFNLRPNDLLEKLHLSSENHHRWNSTNDPLTMYENLKRLEMKIIEFASKLSQGTLSEKEVEEVDRILRSIRELVFAAKSLKDIQRNILELSQSSQQYERD